MADVILEITDEGYSQLLKNANFEGFNLEITKVEPVSGTTKIGSYSATGISRRNDEIVIKSTITSTAQNQSFNFDKLNLVDKSGVVFAVVRNSDNSVLDSVTPFKKATINLKLRYDLSKNSLIVIQDLSSENIAIIVHSLDESAHEDLFSRYMTRDDIGASPDSSIDTGRGLRASYAAEFDARIIRAHKILTNLNYQYNLVNTRVWEGQKPCLFTEVNHGNGLRQKIVTFPSFSMADGSYIRLDSFEGKTADYQSAVIRFDIPTPFHALLSASAYLHPPIDFNRDGQYNTYQAYIDFSEWVTSVDISRSNRLEVYTQFRRFKGGGDEALGATFILEGY